MTASENTGGGAAKKLNSSASTPRAAHRSIIQKDSKAKKRLINPSLLQKAATESGSGLFRKEVRNKEGQFCKLTSRLKILFRNAKKAIDNCSTISWFKLSQIFIVNISFLNHCVFVKGSFLGKIDTKSKLALETHKLLFVSPFGIPLKKKEK